MGEIANLICYLYFSEAVCKAGEGEPSLRSEPGMCCGNEDSCGSENGKLREKNIFYGGKKSSILFFYEN